MRSTARAEHLVAQGFIAFVREMGSGRLFYRTRGWTNAKSNPVHNRPERTRNRLGDWVRSLGITDRELSPNHAWRHTFKARAARYGIADRYSDAITGTERTQRPLIQARASRWACAISASDIWAAT